MKSRMLTRRLIFKAHYPLTAEQRAKLREASMKHIFSHRFLHNFSEICEGLSVTSDIDRMCGELQGDPVRDLLLRKLLEEPVATEKAWRSNGRYDADMFFQDVLVAFGILLFDPPDSKFTEAQWDQQLADLAKEILANSKQ